MLPSSVTFVIQYVAGNSSAAFVGYQFHHMELMVSVLRAIRLPTILLWLLFCHSRLLPLLWQCLPLPNYVSVETFGVSLFWCGGV